MKIILLNPLSPNPLEKRRLRGIKEEEAIFRLKWI
jgi:hypothetical protein